MRADQPPHQCVLEFLSHQLEFPNVLCVLDALLEGASAQATRQEGEDDVEATWHTEGDRDEIPCLE